MTFDSTKIETTANLVLKVGERNSPEEFAAKAPDSRADPSPWHPFFALKNSHAIKRKAKEEDERIHAREEQQTVVLANGRRRRRQVGVAVPNGVDVRDRRNGGVGRRALLDGVGDDGGPDH